MGGSFTELFMTNIVWDIELVNNNALFLDSFSVGRPDRS